MSANEAGGLFSVRDRVACVTGASSGLGQAMATALAEAGARVVGVARRADRLAEWQAGTAGETATVAADVADIAGTGALAERVADPFGPPDILVAAAGVNPRIGADAITPAEWDASLTLNLTAPFFLAQALVPAMKARGWGRIVTIASLQTYRAMPNGISYGAAKAGIGQLTRAMAEAWSPAGVTANALVPGFFPTELTAPVFSDEALAAKNAAQTCIGRNGRMQDIVGPLLFLCSPASDYVTGQLLAVDGGYTAK